jgi:hypothetical protein
MRFCNCLLARKEFAAYELCNLNSLAIWIQLHFSSDWDNNGWLLAGNLWKSMITSSSRRTRHRESLRATLDQRTWRPVAPSEERHLAKDWRDHTAGENRAIAVECEVKSGRPHVLDVWVLGSVFLLERGEYQDAKNLQVTAQPIESMPCSNQEGLLDCDNLCV